MAKGCILVSGPIALIGHYGYIYNIRVNNSFHPLNLEKEQQPFDEKLKHARILSGVSLVVNPRSSVSLVEHSFIHTF